MNIEIQSRLETLAFKKTIPFCYGCYSEAPTGRCAKCFSDDLMRLLPGVGCEYGTEWVIEDLLGAVEKVDLSERFEDSIRSCYPEETSIGWLKVDTASAIKDLDPISWDLAKSEWADSEEQEGTLLTFDNGSTYFDPSEIESFLDSEGV